MLSERILKLPGFSLSDREQIIILENGSARNAPTRLPLIVSPCIRCAALEKKNLKQILIFKKLRAYSDFALEVPYNPSKIAADMKAILESLSDEQLHNLTEQIDHLEEDITRYCG